MSTLRCLLDVQMQVSEKHVEMRVYFRNCKLDCLHIWLHGHTVLNNNLNTKN